MYNYVDKQGLSRYNNGVLAKLSEIDLKRINDGSVQTFNTSGVWGDPGTYVVLTKGDTNNSPIYINVTELETYMETSDDILGLCVDFENNTFTRLAGAIGREPGEDFDGFRMYGGRKRCNVADDGTILAYYNDSLYKEDGTNGQVMVYQPKFYYLVTPGKYAEQNTGNGYRLSKVNYYISELPHPGFKLHPVFYDKNGNEVDYILLSAYEGSIYDTSALEYLTLDEQVMDENEDKFCSIAGVKPASGSSQNLTRINIERLAQNRGADWHGLTIQAVSMEQLLCMIEIGTMNFQTAIGKGVVSYSYGSGNESANTGSTSSLGNRTGEATSTTQISSSGTTTIGTTSGTLSITYRGVENDWGNIWKSCNGINVYGDGNQAGGQSYICNNFNFAENKNNDNYKSTDLTIANTNGYISEICYSTKCDWLFMVSECLGNSSLPTGDYISVASNLNGYRAALLGGAWYDGSNAGGFCWNGYNTGATHHRIIGGRLIYVPTTDIDLSGYATATALNNKVDKVSGKGLSTNDYTTTEKNKLSGIETNAEVNTIESISVNGLALTPNSNKNVDIDLSGYATTTALVGEFIIKTEELGGLSIGAGASETVTFTELNSMSGYNREILNADIFNSSVNGVTGTGCSKCFIYNKNLITGAATMSVTNMGNSTAIIDLKMTILYYKPPHNYVNTL